ncbi:dihydrofolate reductase family protein [Microbacterium sp. PMB16]|uniref:dihydrofolate reductase family protein n=1 Tax=Microbacterium sp. PMB16 TaxID=3120157 RepID=UPI003F4B4762
MRTLIVNNIVSLDGFIAAADGNPLVLQMDGSFDRANLESIESAAVVLLGRDSFDGFSSYWPSVADAPAPSDPDSPEGRALDEVNRAISRAFNRLPKVVVSDRGAIDPANAWHDSTTVISRDAVAGWVREAKEMGDGAIVVFASPVLWNVLLAEGLVDEFHLMISPNTLGSGIPAFTTPAQLELHETRSFDDSSNVQLRYAVR